MVAFLKVAPKSMVNPGSIENMDDSDLTDEEIELQYQKKVKEFADSSTWEVARTIYLSFSMVGSVAIDDKFDRS